MPAWKPVKVAQLEIAQELKSLAHLDNYAGLYLLVRYHQQPIGWLWLANSEGSVSQIQTAIHRQLAWKFTPLLLAGSPNNPSPPGPFIPISVVVYETQPAGQLEDCLRALLALDYPTYEIIVITNDSSPGHIPPSLIHPSLCYIYEPQTGLNRARNRAIAEAHHPIVAFIDPAARPDPNWLRAIAAAFADPAVMAVTGLVAPASLETRAQMRLEFDYGGPGRGFSRRLIHRHALTQIIRQESKRDRHDHLWRGPLAPAELLSAHLFGTGHNMAFRRDVFTAIGPFDLAFDAIPGGRGGDIELFHRLVMAGYTLIYEPAALVWQLYPARDIALNREVYANGQAMGAYLFACIRNRTLKRRSILSFALHHWLFKRIVARLIWPSKLPRKITLLELRGALTGPFIYYNAAKSRAGQPITKTAAPAMTTFLDPTT